MQIILKGAALVSPDALVFVKARDYLLTGPSASECQQ